LIWFITASSRSSQSVLGVQLHCDNQIAIYLAKNQVYHARTMHIDVRFSQDQRIGCYGWIVTWGDPHLWECNRYIDKACYHRQVQALLGLDKCLQVLERIGGGIPKLISFKWRYNTCLSSKRRIFTQGVDCWNKWLTFSWA
jgi:hypothetical protein